MIHFLSAEISFSMTVCCIFLLRPLALRLGLVDMPDIRKQHQGHIPLIGGIAMLMGLLAGLLTLPISLQNYRGYIAGCGLLVFIGLFDDFHELSPKSRFLAQIMALLLMIFWGGIVITHLGNLIFFKAIHLNHLSSLLVTLIAGLGVINAINMVDGVDGLAGTLVFIELSLLFYCATATHHFFSQEMLLLLLMACVLAFLGFNFPFPCRTQAQVFMGDAGSMLLGFSLVWFLIELSQCHSQPIMPVTMLWIVSVPLFDATAVMLYRLLKGQPPIFSDRQHGHHVLMALNFSPLQINILFGCLNVVFGLIGLCAFYYQFNESVMFLSFLILFIIYFFIV
ncbi:undecaprenyl-phosphate alpha-N-acetylglucosaminyl 1-phosphate transferase, partial [Rickettsiella grylli]|uniref:undecaprenyl/decaprenyl-phosphate alpha-N-acetylglucosaminyl 1-phosphate transferase n=1 Tax=Rickettsiella grylli TaxID=59196 RepID=UPI0008FD3712